MSNEPEQQLPQPDSPAAFLGGWRSRINPALAVAVAAMVLLAVQWLDTRQRANALEQTLSRRLAEFDARNKESRVLAAQAQETVREATAKLSLLEQKFAETQSQQVALDALYQELSRNRDEWTLAEVEQILLVASQQLQLAGNAKAALIALQTADSRLQRVDKPQFFGLRKAINKDIEQLQALPYVDVTGLSLRLDSLIAAADELPLNPGRIAQEEKPPVRQAAGENFWQRLGVEVWQDFRQMVRIQNMEKPELPLLPPSQAYFLRENLKLRLLAARVALLQHNEASYKTDIKAAEEWVSRHFDVKDKATRGALATLHQLAQTKVSIELPDISAGLNTLRTLKLGREKGGR